MNAEGRTGIIGPWLDRLCARTVESGRARGLKMVRNRRCSVFVSGDYEPPVQKVLTEYLREGDVFVDIGANVGFFSLIAARVVGPSGRVYAFEPIPDNAEVIRRNITVNDMANITLVPRAASSLAGVEEIWVTRYPGGATLASVGEVPDDACGKLEIQKIAIDEWMQDTRGGVVRLVKVDAEGAELAALQGMSKLLTQHHPVVLVELDDPSVDGLAGKMDALTDWLERVGYRGERMPDSYSNQQHQVAHVLAQKDGVQ